MSGDHGLLGLHVSGGQPGPAAIILHQVQSDLCRDQAQDERDHQRYGCFHFHDAFLTPYDSIRIVAVPTIFDSLSTNSVSCPPPCSPMNKPVSTPMSLHFASMVTLK